MISTTVLPPLLPRSTNENLAFEPLRACSKVNQAFGKMRPVYFLGVVVIKCFGSRINMVALV